MTYNSVPWVIEHYSPLTGGGGVQKEKRKAFASGQRFHIDRALKRIEKHGREVADCGKVKGSKRGLEELRLNAPDVAVRFLFSMEESNICLLLVCYKEDIGDIPPAKIKTAERRLDELRISVKMNTQIA